MQGRVSAGGRPLAGVVCSDGRSVVRTDDDGTFEIDPRGPFVFVSVPSGYATARWYVPSDGELHFDLDEQPQTVPFSLVQIADLHLSLRGWAFGGAVATTPASIAALLDEVTMTRPDIAFVLMSGDQTNNGTDAEFEAYLAASAGTASRIVAIAGNHDHNSTDAEAALRDGARFGPGVAYTPYDRFMGPRWFSFDYAGVHFVAIDWTTYHLGLEVGVQEAWVRADLSCVDEDTPVVFFTHDLMQRPFFETVGARPVASFSGHWHTSRVVRADGALHVNTAPATFGGLDYAPAQWRVATWDGARMSIETIVRGTSRTPAASDTAWTAHLEGGAHRAGPVVAGDTVIAASSDEDTPRGTLEAFDASTGDRRWLVELDSSVKSTPLVVDGRAIAVAVTGETVCVDVGTGAELWRTEIDDPLRLWTYLRPATDGERVFVGDTARFGALDLRDGSVVWMRDDLGVRGNITCTAHPVVADGMLVVSFAAQVPDVWVLDAASGDTIRPTDIAPGSVYDLGPADVARSLVRGPVSGFARDPDAPDVYVVRLGNRLERFRVADGKTVWTAEVGSFFNPATPTVDGEDVFVCQGDGVVRCLARADGTLRWTTTVTTSSPVAMGPYRSGGGVLLAEAIVDGDVVLVTCGDGRALWLDGSDGRVTREVQLGAPVASPAAIGPELVYLLAMDGSLTALARS